MATLKSEIEGWLKAGLKKKATHMVVVCDTFDHDDYPVYVSAGEDAREVVAQYEKKDMQRVVEVYSLVLDLEKQLGEFRAFHYETIEDIR